LVGEVLEMAAATHRLPPDGEADPEYLALPHIEAA